MRGRVVLGVAGGIAAFRAVEVLRLLVKAGCRVYPILTRNATRFVSPRTFAVLSGQRAQVSLWSRPDGPRIDHTELSRVADLLLIAPATANVLAKLASGVADDALTTYALAHRRGLVLAPAMNSVMWLQPAVRRAVEKLVERGAVLVPPVTGQLADGEVGPGKFPSAEVVASAALAALPPAGPLAGVRVLITAGPTREPIDAVRVISNRSSGRMGVALAEQALALGARVVLAAGPGVGAPPGAEVARFETAADLEVLLARLAPRTDVVFHAAAVADFRPAAVNAGKLDRRGGGLDLRLEPVPDLAAGMPRRDGRPLLVIFAAEMSADLEARAVRKLEGKNADVVVANPIDEAGVGMESPRNRAVVITRSGERREFAAQAKEGLARELLLALAPDMLRRLER
ncbi:MAG: bifunctional phosphopantothenoylcysteine decarboxylase/phosphopantothenate--cysteine ligase CoaBC [Acidobacteriota bacterium]